MLCGDTVGHAGRCPAAVKRIRENKSNSVRQEREKDDANEGCCSHCYFVR